MIPTPYLALIAAVFSLFITACGGSSSNNTPEIQLPPNQVPESHIPPDGTPPTPPDNEVTAPKQANYQWHAYERSEEFPSTSSEPLWIEVHNNNKNGSIRLSATLVRPQDANGVTVSTPLPTIVTLTGYSQSLVGLAPPPLNSLAGADPYFVQRGYNYLTVDMRGTGSSEGAWQAFGALSTQNDIPQILDFIVKQEWSNGSVAINGPSLMGINGLFAGATQHPSVKAIFATVPMGDAYRDIVFQGGQINIGFIPLWIGLVEGLGLFPTPAEVTADNPTQLINNLITRIQSLVIEEFPIGTISKALLNLDGMAYDSEFWRERSVIEFADKIQVPTFIVGGLDDLFQRGEPLLYEALKNHTTAKLLMGPWQHLDGSMIAGLPDYGLPEARQIQLAWFDRYLKEMDTKAEAFPAVTQYFKVEDTFYTLEDWPHPETTVQTFYLKGKPENKILSSSDLINIGKLLNETINNSPLGSVTNLLSTLVSQVTLGIVDINKLLGSVVGVADIEKLGDTLMTLIDPAPGKLITEPNTEIGTSSVLQHPIGGLCSRSSSQWTAGILGMLMPFCAHNNNINEMAEITFTTEPLEEDMIIYGPIAAELWVSTTAHNTGLSVTITQVDESGIVSTALTNGVLLGSMRHLEEEKSRYLEGKLIQPWHPFTQAAELTVTPGEPFLAQVEIFPTSAIIKKGQRLRVSISSSDVTHGLSTLPDILAGPIGVLTIHSDPERPSRVNIPLIPRSALHHPTLN